MITARYARMMARYNAWQNDSLITAATGLSDEARRADCGAFFGSLHGTFCHLLWGDETWMSRFSGSTPPEVGSIAGSPGLCETWDAFLDRRRRVDGEISAWADQLDDAALEGAFRWFSGALNAEVERPKAILVMHFFNHQTHHRGQIHAMLTAAGARPADTDLFAMPRAEQIG